MTHLAASLAVVFALAILLAAPIVPWAETIADPRPGRDYQSAETRALETDEAANPAYLWLEDGKKLWRQPQGPEGRSCETCHGSSEAALPGVAARYPRVSPSSGKLVNIERQINICRTGQQNVTPLAYESAELLALTLLVTHRSRGIARNPTITGPAERHFARGQSLWTMRQGQLDLACTQCHDENVGKHLRGDRISQGQSDGWPAYRLEWQTLGSLHRRLRACSLGVRAEVLDYGSDDYLALELYLAWRGSKLPVSAPGVRR